MSPSASATWEAFTALLFQLPAEAGTARRGKPQANPSGGKEDRFLQRLAAAGWISRLGFRTSPWCSSQCGVQGRAAGGAQPMSRGHPGDTSGTVPGFSTVSLPSELPLPESSTAVARPAPTMSLPIITRAAHQGPVPPKLRGLWSLTDRHRGPWGAKSSQEHSTGAALAFLPRTPRSYWHRFSLRRQMSWRGGLFPGRGSAGQQAFWWEEKRWDWSQEEPHLQFLQLISMNCFTFHLRQ